MDHWWHHPDRYRGWIHFPSGISPIICGIHSHRNRRWDRDNFLNFKRKGIKAAQYRGIMTKEKFLTVRWNNLLSLALGIPALIYAVVVLSTSTLSDRAGFIGLVVIGVLY